jgi:adenine-specific DNA-methyltransferase
LKESVLPIVGRTEQLKGIAFCEDERVLLAGKGKRVFLFSPSSPDGLNEAEKRYIALGEKSGYNGNYKCRIRKRWYEVPLTWAPEAFLVRQANHYLRMVYNEAGSLATDTLHKVRFKTGVDGKAVTAAFLNTYTLALSETLGRSYGGGVLTFEPGEIRRLAMPMENARSLDFASIDAWQREGQIGRILAHTDQVLLVEGLGLSGCEISMLHGIWDKMRERRLQRKRSIAVPG